MSKVGFIGLGIMGRPMAENLVKAGQDVMVSDLNAKVVEELCALGASSGTYAELARSCDLYATNPPHRGHRPGGAFRRKRRGLCPDPRQSGVRHVQRHSRRIPGVLRPSEGHGRRLCGRPRLRRRAGGHRRDPGHHVRRRPGRFRPSGPPL